MKGERQEMCERREGRGKKCVRKERGERCEGRERK